MKGYKTSNSHSTVSEDLGILGYDSVLLGELFPYHRETLYQSSNHCSGAGFSSSKHIN
jgi:hypothetical protein